MELKHKRKKIIFIQRYKNFGGAEIQINYLKSRFQNIKNIEISTIILEDLSSSFIFGYLKIFLKLCDFTKYDFLFFYQIYFFPLGLITKYVFRKKIIYSERIYSHKNEKRKNIYKYLLREDLFIVNSEYTKEMYSEIKKNIAFISNQIPSISYNYLPELKKPTTIALISRLSKEKNLIPTFQNFTNSEIDLVFNIYYTSSNESYKKDLLCFISENSLTINLKGKKSIENIYSNNDIILHPSKFEGTSNVILEAGYNQKPILMATIPQNSILNFHEYSYYNSFDILIKKIEEFKSKKNKYSQAVKFNQNSVKNYINGDDWVNVEKFFTEDYEK
jgi:hypothetical protein